jgi:predicted deacylase
MTEVPSAPVPPSEFPVRVGRPDISRWIAGNTGIAGITTFESGRPGPHVALTAVMHGNEISGAIVLDRLLRAGVRPRCGKVSLGFMNLAAFDRFDPSRPTTSRFVDEDMNRLWDPAMLDGPRHSLELDRARALRPWVETVDVLVDLHSTLCPSDPVTLCGLPARGWELATAIGGPAVAVADRGHDAGRRLIDYPRFSDPDRTAAAILVEAGEHWEPATVELALHCAAGLLHRFGCVCDVLPPAVVPAAMRLARVTDVVNACTPHFMFVQPFRGGHVVPLGNTLIALDGETEVRTPYDDCMMVLPMLRPGRGHTAVRLARFVAD